MSGRIGRKLIPLVTGTVLSMSETNDETGRDTADRGIDDRSNAENEESIVSRNAEFLKATVSVYAAVGLGLGLSLVLLAEVGSLPISYSGNNALVSSQLPSSSDTHETATDSLPIVELYLLPLAIVGIATIVGFDVEDAFDDPKEGAYVAAIGSVAGALALTFVAAILFSIQLPSDLSSFGPGGGGNAVVSLSMNWGGVLIDGLLYGIGAGVTAGLVAYSRTRFR